MPRPTHTIFRFNRGKSHYFAAKVGGRKVYLGLSLAKARARLADLLAGEATGRPTNIADLVLAYRREAKLPEDRARPWLVFCNGGALSLEDVGEDHLAEYHRHLTRTRYRRFGAGGKPGKPKAFTAWTLKHYIGAARRVLAFAASRGWIREMPTVPRLSKPNVAPRDLPGDFVAEFLASVRMPTRNIIGFIAYTGCRVSEACALRWDWYRPDMGSGVFVIPPDEHKTGAKTGESRTIYLTPPAREIVDALPRRGPLVFRNRLGRPFTSGGIRSVSKRKGVGSPYALRHTYATSALAQGVPLHIVGQLLGHRDIKTTTKYARVLSEQVASAATGLLTPVRVQPVASQPPSEPDDASERRQPRGSRHSARAGA